MASTFSISPTHRSQTLPARIATNCRQSLGKTYVMAGMVGFADYEAESNSNFQISRLRFFGMSMPSMTGSGPYSQELTSADFLLGRTGHRVQPGPAGSIGFCSFPSRLQLSSIPPCQPLTNLPQVDREIFLLGLANTEPWRKRRMLLFQYCPRHGYVWIDMKTEVFQNTMFMVCVVKRTVYKPEAVQGSLFWSMNPHFLLTITLLFAVAVTTVAAAAVAAAATIAIALPKETGCLHNKSWSQQSLLHGAFLANMAVPVTHVPIFPQECIYQIEIKSIT